MITARRGLGAAGARLRRGPCRVGFIGASVTAQREGYASHVVRELSRATGHVHTSVVVSAAAMGSIGGVFLMDSMFEGRMPDVCVVEFTTSDLVGHTPASEIAPCLDGIARKLARRGVCAVILHLFRDDVDPASCDAVRAAYHDVAELHGLPEIDLAAAWNARAADRAHWMRDVVHLTPAGAAACGGEVAVALLRLADAGGPGADAPRPRTGSYEHARVVPVEARDVADPESCERRTFRHVYPVTDVPSSTRLTFEAQGGFRGALVLQGPRSGVVEFSDSNGAVTVPLFDEHCDYERLGLAVIVREYERPERVGLRLTRAVVDPSICRRPPPPCAAGDRRLSIIGWLMRG